MYVAISDLFHHCIRKHISEDWASKTFFPLDSFLIRKLSQVVRLYKAGRKKSLA